MRKVLRMTLLVGVFLYGSTAMAIGPSDWSWRDGLLGSSVAGNVFGDAGPTYPGYLCDRCRDPEEFPVDFAAVAYNGYFGDDPWMWDSKLGIPFRIYNLQREWVVVWFEGVLFDVPTFLPNTLDIRLRLPNGRIITITALQGGPDMPIGDIAPAAPRAGGDSCYCGGGGGESDDDPVDDDESDYGWPEIERYGSVDIVDPDEDGEFPEWEEEL